jgi:uncharacterized protein YcaQ
VRQAATRKVTLEQARRIAVRAQLLDGSARGVLDTVRRLGFLQLDPIATVAKPQHLVLWSRLGPFDTGELDRLLWQDRALFEWNAFVWPIETLPMIRALMRKSRRANRLKHERWAQDFLGENRAFRRYVIRRLELDGPLLGRDLEDRSAREPGSSRWWGDRYVGRMLELLNLRGEIAVVGRRNGQRLWDLAERWYPDTEAVPLRDAERMLAEQRFRSLGVRRERGGWIAHEDASDEPVDSRVTLLSPFDRLIHDRARTEALFDFRYRLEMYVPAALREYGYYVLPILVGDRLVGRAEPRLDRKQRKLELIAAWGDTSRLDEALASLAAFIGADDAAKASVSGAATGKARRPARTRAAGTSARPRGSG